MRVFTTSSTTTLAPLTSSSETSISLGRYRTWGERPAPISGTAITSMSTTTSTSAGKSETICGLRRGELNTIGWPLSTRTHAHTAKGASTRYNRHSRRRRARSLATATSAAAVRRTRDFPSA